MHIQPPSESIYRRLGYREGITRINPKQRDQIERHIKEALGLIVLKGVVRRMPIQKKKGSALTLAPKIILSSQRLSEFIGNCDELVVMGATAGDKIMKVLYRESAGKNLTAAVVYDAVASEMVDASLDWIMDFCNQQLRRENKQLTTNRFSAGYGDFLLENQKLMYDILALGELGISLTDRCILKPEKSVTAIAGIQGVGK